MVSRSKVLAFVRTSFHILIVLLHMSSQVRSRSRTGGFAAAKFEKEDDQQLVAEDRCNQFTRATSDHPTLAPIVGWCFAVRLSPIAGIPVGAPGERRTALLGAACPIIVRSKTGRGLRPSDPILRHTSGRRPARSRRTSGRWRFGRVCPRTYPAPVIGRSVWR